MLKNLWRVFKLSGEAIIEIFPWCSCWIHRTWHQEHVKVLYSLHNKYIKDRKRERIGAGFEEKTSNTHSYVVFRFKGSFTQSEYKVKTKYMMIVSFRSEFWLKLLRMNFQVKLISYSLSLNLKNSSGLITFLFDPIVTLFLQYLLCCQWVWCLL